ncbi:MAG: chromosome segregation ATPase [Synechococcales cyanobacterium CRU_2_2]|nr:chromosome segregation ATPase [Synechococcales cyanobacterium CRU_2_2]
MPGTRAARSKVWPRAGQTRVQNGTRRQTRGQPSPGDGLEAKTAVADRPAQRATAFSGQPRWMVRLLMSWQLWILLATGGVGATGSLAVMSLLRLPQAWECPRVFWPLASASLRVYCAQATADKATHRGLLDAIALVEPLPDDHPLRPMVDRNIRRWSLQLMDVTEELFQDGDLAAALETADKIPYKHLPCNDSECPKEFMERRKTRWKETWEKAEKIFADSEKALINQKWTLAAEIAAQLLSVENRFWRTTKYEEISTQVQEVRGTNSVLAKARKLAEKGDLESIIEAVKLAATIPSSSRLYPVAKGALARFGGQLMDLAEAALEEQDLSEALSIVDQIPEQANLKKEIKDFRVLARAQARTWSGSVGDLQSAIADAKAIGADRPLYAEAQKLIVRWQTEIVDVARIEKAQKIAASGNIPNLMAAIAEISLIPKTNPRWDEAQQLMQSWTDTIQTQEDSPFLERAERLAQGGTAEAYQAAIAEASRVGKGRVLHGKASTRIDDWQSKLEWLQDQPFLAQARGLAAAGNLQGAIAAAQQIGPGRSLHREAQDAISGWQAARAPRMRWRRAPLCPRFPESQRPSSGDRSGRSGADLQQLALRRQSRNRSLE